MMLLLNMQHVMAEILVLLHAYGAQALRIPHHGLAILKSPVARRARRYLDIQIRLSFKPDGTLEEVNRVVSIPMQFAAGETLEDPEAHTLLTVWEKLQPLFDERLTDLGEHWDERAA